jgi:hypothetical protein
MILLRSKELYGKTLMSKSYEIAVLLDKVDRSYAITDNFRNSSKIPQEEQNSSDGHLDVPAT